MRSFRARNPSKSAICPSPQPLKARNPSRHAIRQVRNLFKSASGEGGPPARLGRRDGAGQLPGTKYGAANRRRKTAWQRPGSKPAAALLPARPIGRAEWCRQSAARSMVPPNGAARGMVPGNCPARSMVPAIAGTVWCRQSAARFLAARFWAAGNSPPIGGPCWPGGRSELGIPRPGCGVWECGCLGACGVWECGCLGACGAGGCGCPGMRSLGMRSLGEMRSPGTVRRPIGRRKRCRPIGRHRMVLPFGSTCRRLEWCRQSAARFRRRPAEPPADWPAARSWGGGVARSLGGPRKDAWGRPGSGR